VNPKEIKDRLDKVIEDLVKIDKDADGVIHGMEAADIAEALLILERVYIQ